MIDNKKIPTWLGVVIIVIFSATAVTFVLMYEKIQQTIEQSRVTYNTKKSASTQSPTIEKQDQNTDTTDNESKNIEWKTYKNKLVGLEFNYPADWGDVVIENGNINNTNIPPCKAPIMMSYLQKQYPWGLYNTTLKFSKTPIDFEIRLVELNTSNNPKEVCNDRGERIELSTIQPKIKDKEILIINKSGVEFILDPVLFNSINTSLEGPTYTTKNSNKLIWIYSGFTPYYDTPEEIELRKYIHIPKCQNGNSYNADRGCGIVAWVQSGKTSEKIRKSFNNVNELVQSLIINQ